MRSKLVIFTAFAVLGASMVPTAAAKPKRWDERVVWLNYTYVRSSNQNPAEYHLDEPLTVEPEHGEKRIMLDVMDWSGQRVAVNVSQDADQDGRPEVEHEICGHTPEPLKIKPDAEVSIHPTRGQCADGTVSPMTSGRIKVTLQKKVPVEPRITREVKLSFTGPSGVGFGNTNTIGGPFSGVGGVITEIGTNERWVSVELEDDATGLPVRAQLGELNSGAPSVEVCGKTAKPLPVTPGDEIILRILEGVCADGTPTGATTGTITLTFSNIP